MSKCYDNPDYDDLGNGPQNTWEHQHTYEQKHEAKVMKNIYILQTDKPSRLACDFDKLILNSRLLSPILYKNQNIYITSDEEIKEGDWFMSDYNSFPMHNIKELSEREGILGWKQEDLKNNLKIILTTDQDLINDGLQAIDDEFLEWFVKNPSCEEIEVEKYCRNGLCDSRSRSKTYNLDEHCHEDLKDKCWYSGCQCPGERLIIPKEQPKYPIGGYAPGNYMCNCSTCKTQFQGDKRAVQCEPCAIKMVQKQNIIDMMKGDEELGLYDEIQPEQIWNEEKKKGIKQLIQDHKKETLEEFAERLCPNKQVEYDMIIEGAKWQQQRSYSEEEVLEIIRQYALEEHLITSSKPDIWFEQFKKK